MRVKTLIFLILLLVAVAPTSGQTIFPEIYKGCVTDQFGMERDTTKAKLDAVDFLNALEAQIGPKTYPEIRGKMRLQILVDTLGHSCLLSVENQTNFRTKKLNLKEWVDQEVIWGAPKEKVSAVIALEFTEVDIAYNRYGLDGKKGWHIIE